MPPEEFLKRMKDSMDPEEFSLFLRSFEEEAHKSLRINGLKKTLNPLLPELKAAFSLERVPWCEKGYYYDRKTDPGKHPLHEAGLYYIQEASAMAPVGWLDLKKGHKVLDLCAAPGGKSTYIADVMENTGLLVANEPVKKRAKILSLNVERLGIANTLVTNETPERLSMLFGAFFDRILVDAPCSGEGMFRKDGPAKEEWSPENVKMCGERQDKILSEAAKMLVPGGIMVYSTCTFSNEEDEGSIERFLAGNKDFSLMDPEEIRPLHDSWTKTSVNTGSVRPGSAVRIWPHRAKGEGHFFAVLKRDGKSPEGMRRISGSGSLKPASPGSVKLFEDFRKSFVPGFSLKGGIIHSFGDQLYHSNEDMPGTDYLKVLRPGLHLGTVKKDRFEPSHALALFLSPDMASIRCTIESREEALKYLKGESLPAVAGMNNGWCLMDFMGCSLGWGKSDGRIIKNHYPKGLR